MWRVPLRLFSQLEIFISNLPVGFRREDLSKIVPESSEYNISKSYCFVKLPLEADAENIIKQLNSLKLNNNLLRAKLSRTVIKSQKSHQSQSNVAIEKFAEKTNNHTDKKLSILTKEQNNSMSSEKNLKSESKSVEKEKSSHNEYVTQFDFTENYPFRKDFALKAEFAELMKQLQKPHVGFTE